MGGQSWLRKDSDDRSGFDLKIGAQCASTAATIVVIIAAIVLIALL